MQDKDTENIKYIAIQMSHFKGIFDNRSETVNKAICGGLYHYGTNLQMSLESAVKTCLVEFLNDRNVFVSIAGFLNENEINELENSDLFNDDMEIDLSLLKMYFPDFKIPESLKPDLIECAKIILAMKNLNITGDPESIYHVGKSLPKAKIFVGIKPETLYQFRDENKAEFDVMQFMLYAALKSIIGTKKAIKTNKGFVFNRMFENPTDKEKQLIKKYNSRYQWQKLIDHLGRNWGLNYYSYFVRGFYFSFKMSMEKLIRYAEKRKPKNRITEMEKKNREIREKVLQEMKTENEM